MVQFEAHMEDAISEHAMKVRLAASAYDYILLAMMLRAGDCISSAYNVADGIWDTLWPLAWMGCYLVQVALRAPPLLQQENLPSARQPPHPYLRCKLQHCVLADGRSDSGVL